MSERKTLLCPHGTTSTYQVSDGKFLFTHSQNGELCEYNEEEYEQKAVEFERLLKQMPLYIRPYNCYARVFRHPHKLALATEYDVETVRNAGKTTFAIWLVVLEQLGYDVLWRHIVDRGDIPYRRAKENMNNILTKSGLEPKTPDPYADFSTFQLLMELAIRNEALAEKLEGDQSWDALFVAKLARAALKTTDRFVLDHVPNKDD